MKDHGFLRVAAVSPRIALADPLKNEKLIAKAAADACEGGAALVVFPELCLTGYTLEDLFLSESLLSKAEEALFRLCDDTADLSCALVAGLPLRINGGLYDCAAVLQKGAIKGIVPRTDVSGLPRFSSGSDLAPDAVFSGVQVGARIFRDPAGRTFAVAVGSDPRFIPDPLFGFPASGAGLIVDPGARPYTAGSFESFKNRLSVRSSDLGCAYVYAGAGPCESTTDSVFSGECLIFENGELLASAGPLSRETVSAVSDVDLGLIGSLSLGKKKSRPYWPGPMGAYRLPAAELEALPGVEKLIRSYPRDPFVPEKNRTEYCREVLEIQATALAERLERANVKKAVIGVSGGSDSTLALLAAARAMQILGRPSTDVLGITMPGFGTTERTRGNAEDLMEALGCEIRCIPIGKAAELHLKDIGHDLSDRNVTYENAQARERTQILMDVANDINGLVVGTGDMSETALGWCTYGGDQLAMYGVNSGLTKGLVKAVIAACAEDAGAGAGPFGKLEGAGLVARTLKSILDTPVSPELLPPSAEGEIAQITEDHIGPYELHDFFLYHLVFLGRSRDNVLWLASQVFEGSYDEDTIDKWLTVFCRRFASQQFKRDSACGCPQVGPYSLSPRKGFVIPSDGTNGLWR
ncbi:MAG: NAD(+) synthase [Firmicutes bacterium]|nr:NAD(+) synthase [Bacillota bacterium]